MSSKLITLQAYGFTVTIPEEELIKKMESRLPYLKNGIQSVEDVNPRSIDLSLFEKERDNEEQERMRLFVWKRRRFFSDYGSFEYIIPSYCKYTRSDGTVKNLVWYVDQYGDYADLKLADSIHQAMLFAQKITKGKTWESLCNQVDKIKTPRIISDSFADYYEYYIEVGGNGNAEGYLGNPMSGDTRIGNDCWVPALIRYKK